MCEELKEDGQTTTANQQKTTEQGVIGDWPPIDQVLGKDKNGNDVIRTVDTSRYQRPIIA